MESEQLFEMWENLKSYIPVKDRLEAGEVFIRMLDDSGMSSDDIEILVDEEDFNDDEEDWE